MTEDDPHGWVAFWELWDNGTWEPETHAWIESKLAPGDLFLDIGAWIGPTVLWAFQTGADVIAIEPDPVAFPELQRVIGQLPEVELVNAALVVNPGIVHLGRNDRYGGDFGDSMSHLVVRHQDGTTGDVAVFGVDLDYVLNGRIPTAVKMDVEGYEYELLPHILPQLAEWRCEVHISFHDENNVPQDWFDRFDWSEVHGLDVIAGFDR